MDIQGITVEETALHGGANLRVIITHDDLTQATAATAQTLEVLKVANGQLVDLTDMQLVTPFEDTADAANNTTPITVGDGASTARYLASTELNLNGTEVLRKTGTGTRFQYTAADTVDVVFTAPAAGKTLAALNKGELHLYLRVLG